jgi:hydroxymethylbilane synthase
MSIETVRIATRKSPLALWQAEEVARRLKAHHPNVDVVLVGMRTKGDKVLDSPLAKIGGKGLFVKELEQGLLDGSADIAVHSMKDVPIGFPQGLHLPVILQRDDPRDAFVSNHFATISTLKPNAKIGTSSLRRQCQIKYAHPRFRLENLRGNVNTRLDKLDSGYFDAIILASAGLKRLGLKSRISDYLDTAICLPAIGQGAIGIECRSDDSRVQQLIGSLHDTQTASCIRAERAINERLSGGCQVPLAGFAEIGDKGIHIRALIGYPDGTGIIRGEARGSLTDATDLGLQIAEDLLAQGAVKILRTLELTPPSIY